MLNKFQINFKAITWTNVVLFLWRIFASQSHNMLRNPKVYHAPVLYPFEVVLVLPFKHNRVHAKTYSLQQTFLSPMPSWWPGHLPNYSLSSGKPCYILTLRNISTKFQRKKLFLQPFQHNSLYCIYLQMWNGVWNNHDKTDGMCEDSPKIVISASRVKKNELRKPGT